MSIVLVIVGLIVGGILVGQDLIRAAAVRAQVSQIEKYNSAVNTFQEKYGYLPGDINGAAASQFGFQARYPCPGEGDGNAIIEASSTNGCDDSSTAFGVGEENGETIVFWADLSNVQLIPEGPFSNNIMDFTVGICGDVTCFPEAKLANGTYVYVFSGGINGGDGHNYFGIGSVGSYLSSARNIPVAAGASPGVTVAQAYAIDLKTDDGLPTTGRVAAMYLDSNQSVNSPIWSPNGTNPSAATCFDTTSRRYSINIARGYPNCGLSIRFQ